MGFLRPATPLSVILFVAFVLVLLSTLSTPIIHAIPLGTFQGWNFGVFGYCKGDTCSGYKIGYDTASLFSGNNFDLPSDTRHSLSSILIVHPIAAFFILICFGLAVAAHFHAPSHSPRYLLFLLIFTIPTLLVTLLAFLVDILLFVPHMQWAGWIVLAATVLVIASSIVTCAMRRTLVSRKARKKRIEENAEMNGTSYYETLANRPRLMQDELPRADSPPPISGTISADKPGGVTQFATFEMHRPETKSNDSANDSTLVAGGMTGLSDDRQPLNPHRDPSVRSASSGGGPLRSYGPNGAPSMPMGGPNMEGDAGRPTRRPSRDQYGNVIPAAAAAGMASDLGPSGLRHEGSQGSLGSRGSGPYPRGGGRGGYGPSGRGYGPPRGGYGPTRGGYGPPRGGWRGQGPPPPGWRGRGAPGPVMMGRGGMPRQGPSPPGYPSDPYYGAPRSPRGAPMMDQGPPQTHDDFVAGPIGQAIEMDERTGSPPAPRSPHDPQLLPSHYGLRDSDTDVAGMVDLQRDGHLGVGMPRGSEGTGDPRSPTSIYSEQTYIPPRSQWTHRPPLQNNGSGSSQPLSSNPIPSSAALPLSTVQGSPRSAPHVRGGSDAYYEDVDPRFAVDPASEVGSHASGIPNALTPGGYQAPRMQSPNHLQAPPAQRSNIPSYVSGGGDNISGGETDKEHSSSSLSDPNQRHSPLELANSVGMRLGGDNSDDTLPPGARSPGEGSEASHFTSVSQRPVNPNWRPGPGMYGPPGGPGIMGSQMGVSSASAAQRRREDVILTANPDFTLPGMSPTTRGRGRGRGGMGGGLGRVGSPTAMGLTPGGRYPTDL